MTGLGTLPSTISAVPESGWATLEAELDLWQSAGLTAPFWWRDDDAVAWTPALDRLLALAEGTPLGLAVIPGEAQAELARSLAPYDHIAVLQHGWRHINHAGPGEKKSELGGSRPLSRRLDDLAAGRERLSALFGDRALPILVPPWNRMGEDLIPHLPGLGFRGLSMSASSPRDRQKEFSLDAGLREVHIHVDVIDWHGGRGFIGDDEVLASILRQLRDRRVHHVQEPIGVLTHHLVQDAATDDFLGRLIAVLRRHRAARLVPIPELFPVS